MLSDRSVAYALDDAHEPIRAVQLQDEAGQDLVPEDLVIRTDTCEIRVTDPVLMPIPERFDLGSLEVIGSTRGPQPMGFPRPLRGSHGVVAVGTPQ